MKFKLSLIFIIVIILTSCSTDVDINKNTDNTKTVINKENDNIVGQDDKHKELSDDKDDIEEKEPNEIKDYKITISDDKKILTVEGRDIADYLIENNTAYLLLADHYECANTIELIKYNFVDGKIIELYKKDHITPMGPYSHFLKKLNKEYISLDLWDEIIVFNITENNISNDIIIPENIMYVDLSYNGDKLCYYKGSNLYISNLDFSDEKVLKSNIEDTEDTVQPKWSHDGTKISYFNGYNLEIINLEGKIVESIPRHGRYTKWSHDDNSILIGSLGFYFKINIKDKVIITSTDNGYNEYTDMGYNITIVDAKHPQVVYESNTGILAYMMCFSNNIGCNESANHLILDFDSQIIKNIRWTDKENELAIYCSHEGNGKKSIHLVNVDSNNLIDMNALKYSPPKKNYYMLDNHYIDDEGEWIITSELGEHIQEMNFNTGESKTIKIDGAIKTQALKKWNYIYDYTGIYLLKYDGTKITVVDAGENYIYNFMSLNNGLVYNYRNIVYFYNYNTMENKQIFNEDMELRNVFCRNDYLYIIGGYKTETDNTAIIEYDINSEECKEVYKTSSIMDCKGLGNDTIYFDRLKYNLVSKAVEPSKQMEYEIVEWKDKLYFKSFNQIVVGKSENSLEEITFFDNNYIKNGYFWYFGDNLYLINKYENIICQVDPDTLEVINYVEKVSEHKYKKDHFYSNMYLVNDELIFNRYEGDYKLEHNEPSGVNLVSIEPFKDSINSDETLFLNSKNEFENMSDYNEIAKIIDDEFYEYAYSDEYVIYTDKKNLVQAINRRTNSKIIISNITADSVEIKENNIFFRNKILGVFKYNLEDGQTQKILDGCIYQYKIIGENIYYIDNYLDRTLYVVNMNNGSKLQITDDETIVQKILVIGDELYYLVDELVPILYKINNNKPEYIKLLDIASVNKIFPLNNDEICFVHEMPGNNFIIDTISTKKGQISEEIIYEDDDIIIFNTYLRGYEYGDIICGIYNKHNNKLENASLSFGLERTMVIDDWIYLIGTDYDASVVERININNYEKQAVFDICGELIISPDAKYIAARAYDSEKGVFYNVNTKESKEINLNISTLNYIEDGYIYYEYEGEKYKCSIDNLDESEKIQ